MYHWSAAHIRFQKLCKQRRRQDLPLLKLQNTMERSPQGEGKEVKTEKGKHHVTAQANARKSTPTSHRKCCETPFNCQTPSKMLRNTMYLQGPMI